MHYLYVTPTPSQAFRDETAVALRGSRFATKETAAVVRDHMPIDSPRHIPLVHQRLEAANVSSPVMVLAILGEDLVRRRKQAKMLVITARELTEEVAEVRLLGKTRELATRIQADVDQHVDPMLLEQAKEPLGGFLSEANREKLQRMYPS
jgi:hypothetical protein